MLFDISAVVNSTTNLVPKFLNYINNGPGST